MRDLTLRESYAGVCRGLAVGLVLAVGAVAAATPAAAISFSGTYEVHYLDADPGLVVDVNPSSGSLGFMLDPPTSTTVALFDIWTDECCVNFDDLAASPITVSFAFTAPESASGDINGTTQGFNLFGIVQAGVLTWSGPLLLDFGGSQLLIALSDEIFNFGFFGLGSWGATVEATFTLQDAPIAAPVPAALPLFLGGVGLMGLVGSIRRKNRPAA